MPCEVLAHGISHLPLRCPWIQKNQDRRPGATEGNAQNSHTSGQLLQRRQERAKQGAIGLVHSILQGRIEKVMAALRERRDQQH